MKKPYLAVVSIAAIAILSLLFLGMTGLIPNHQDDSNRPGGAATALVIGDGVERVEVFHFHGTHQCDSCIKVGQYAEDTVNAYFSDELDSGSLSFAHLNGELPENMEKVRQYGVNSASLWIGTYYKNGTFVSDENINVWYKINDKQAYMSYLKGVIAEKLSGV
jgi:hypothetical protein